MDKGEDDWTEDRKLAPIPNKLNWRVAIGFNIFSLDFVNVRWFVVVCYGTLVCEFLGGCSSSVVFIRDEELLSFEGDLGVSWVLLLVVALLFWM
ncbi:hypothetical protein Droror1_Dr00018153, partial [Drosera rotundifolia]